MIEFGPRMHARASSDGTVVIEDWRNRTAPQVVTLTVEQSAQLRQALETCEGRAISFMRMKS